MFTGFTPQTGEFLMELSMHNYRSWFEEHRPVFQKSLKEPFDALARDVMARMEKLYPDAPMRLHISRIYRDARRLFGRGPYKETLWFSLDPFSAGQDGPSLYFEIGAMEWSMGMGCWADAPTMARLRRYMEHHPDTFSRFNRLLAEKKEFTLGGQLYARPKGHPNDQLTQWYNRKSLWIGRSAPFGEILFSATLVDTVVDGFQFLMPFYSAFTEAYTYGDGEM